MFPRSLRWQLTLAFTGVAGLVVLVAAVGMAVLIEHTLWGSLDAALEEEAETLAELRAGPVQDFPSAVARVASDRSLGSGKFIRVTGIDGRVLAESGTIPPLLAGREGPGVPTTQGLTVGREKNVYRVVWYTAADGARTAIGVRARGHLRTLRDARLAIAGTATLLLGTLALLAWTITRRATTELARLATELETVEAGSLDRRLAPRRTAEVDRLAAVLNRLLTRLEAAVGHLRRFTGDAAHELRTPIAALRAHLEVALGRSPSPEAYRTGLLDALEQTERLGRLADDLLTLSAIEAGIGASAREETVHLDALAKEVAESLEPMAHEQGRPFVCRAEPAVVRGAPNLLKRLVLNLVDNAFRHTPLGVAVELVVHASNGAATIQVRDAGPGVPAADIPEMFQRFRRGRSPTTGTGLGLALCREIVTRHGGQIVLESAHSTGTTVTVTLPVAGAPRSSG